MGESKWLEVQLNFVKGLREKSWVFGVMDAKESIVEVEGDIESDEVLREKR